MSDQQAWLTVQIQPQNDSDAAELALLTAELRGKVLNEVDVASVELGRGDAIPHGTKSDTPIVAGMLLVQVAPQALSALTHVISDWIQTRRQIGFVELRMKEDVIRLTNVSRAGQEAALLSFIDKHGR